MVIDPTAQPGGICFDDHAEALRRVQKQAGLGAMAGGIAHHFNNLLQAINGNIELAFLEFPDIPAGLEHRLRASIAAGDRARQLSMSMLQYCAQRTDARDGSLRAQDLELVLGFLQAAAPSRVEFKSDVSAVRQAARIDVDCLEQVLTNLVINAWEAVEGRRGHIWVVGATAFGEELTGQLPEHTAPGAGSWLHLSVRDDGTGMNEETLTRACDPFFTTKAAGRGLGLPLSLAIVRAAGGSMCLDSAPGSGTTVHVLVPTASR
jgi:signal transduction histidine kinase